MKLVNIFSEFYCFVYTPFRISADEKNLIQVIVYMISDLASPFSSLNLYNEVKYYVILRI